LAVACRAKTAGSSLKQVGGLSSLSTRATVRLNAIGFLTIIQILAIENRGLLGSQHVAFRLNHVAILPTDIKPLQHNSVFAVPLKTSKKTAH
jgi:hypothetical protein|tara:strand:- start:233 stop:508 length:276 start_codon:yes stop_codon:yes gene_type:complete